MTTSLGSSAVGRFMLPQLSLIHSLIEQSRSNEPLLLSFKLHPQRIRSESLLAGIAAEQRTAHSFDKEMLTLVVAESLNWGY